MSSNEIVIDVLRRLPEEVTLEEICEEIALQAALRRGERAAEEGRVMAHDEVKRRSAEWTTSK
jgi:predicted transcriptional regulator